MDNFLGFLTPERRKVIYGIVAALAALLVVFGVVSQEQLNTVIQNVTAVVTLLVSLMAALNTNTSGQ